MNMDFAVVYLQRGKEDHPERESLAKEIAEYLRVDLGVSARLENLADSPVDSAFEGRVICVGGDGVLLGGTHTFTSKENEFVLVGAEGRSAAFYAQTDFKSYRTDLQRIIDNKYSLLNATRAKVASEESGFMSPNLLNEAAFKERNTGQMFRYELHVSGRNIGRKYFGACSTVIFATPCGSTAWNMNAGGPIIHKKDCRQIAITPESPQLSIKADPENSENIERDRWNLSVASIFPRDSKIEFVPKVDAVLIKDGRWWQNEYFRADTAFQITAGDPLKLICLRENGYAK